MGWRRVVAYRATYLFWGASFLAIREIVTVAPPFLSAGIRFTLAGLILFLWMRLRGAPLATWRQWLSCAVLGLITNVIVLDPIIGVVKGDLGVRDGRIVGIGKAGNPNLQSGVDELLRVGPRADVIAGIQPDA